MSRIELRTAPPLPPTDAPPVRDAPPPRPEVDAPAINARPVSWGPFLYKEDVVPTAVVATGVALSLAPFVVPMSVGVVAALTPVAIGLRLMAQVHQHHHAHLKVFTNKPLNKLYDTVLMLGGGNVTTGWEMQHCRGHHTMYLDHEKDVAGSKRFTKSGKLRRLIYTVCGDAMSAIDAWRIAGTTNNPAKVRWRLATELGVQALVNGALLAINWPLALATIVVPNVVLRWLVFWHSFEQHDTAPAHDVYDGSVNTSGRLQQVLLNVGHHTAHHKKPTLHWSRLPALTEAIRDLIPKQLRG